MPELLETLREALSGWGNHPVLVESRVAGVRVPIGAGRLREEIEGLARELERWGVRPRQVAALFLENSADFVRVFLALLELGAVPAPLKLEYRKLELDEIFSNCDPPTVIAEGHHLGVLADYLPSRRLITRRDGRLVCDQAGERRGPGLELDDAIASLNYTYRGCGFPLGALVPHDQYLHGARVYQEQVLGERGERMLVVLPMSHIFTLVGCIIVPILYGLTAVILPTLHPRRLFETLAAEGVQYLTAVPEILGLLARLRPGAGALPEFRAFVSGGSVLAAETYREVREQFGGDLMHGYGLTEFAPVSGNIRGQSRGGTVGPLCREVECRLGEVGSQDGGEIQIRTPHMFRGYLNRVAESAACWDGPWFRTGDLGTFADGHLVFLRELKSTCKINGAMVDLAEVRRAVVALPGVRDAEVVYEKGLLSARVEAPPWDGDGLVAAKRSLSCLLAAYKVPRVIVRK